ncbi:TetR/AcrR family transcriptional regulator [Aneurinibacillus migulanus]|uniref:TetR/AcrR family transcriptional regulator n=1 Tax=Aneurinibacillus migulanus TaxID=47500 RepID=UPI002E2253D9|nr:TetR/AcrR family transcriptional regulator [Aneurinibacillus migulanus]
MRKGERTKQMILQKATSIFNQQGYSGSSLSSIMKETGLEKGGIYRHFESKEELALQAFDYSTSLLGERFKEAVSQAATTLDKLNAFIEVLKGLVRGDPIPGGCPIMNVALEADDAYPLLAEQAKMSMFQLLSLMERIIIFGIESKEINPNTNIKQLAILWISSLEGALALSRLYDDPSYFDDVATIYI